MMEPPTNSYLDSLESLVKRRKKENETTGDLGVARPCDEVLWLIPFMSRRDTRMNSSIESLKRTNASVKKFLVFLERCFLFGTGFLCGWSTLIVLLHIYS